MEDSDKPAAMPPKSVAGFGGQRRKRLVIEVFDQRLVKEGDAANTHTTGEGDLSGGPQAPAAFQLPVPPLPRISRIVVPVLVRGRINHFAGMPDGPFGYGCRAGLSASPTLCWR